MFWGYDNYGGCGNCRDNYGCGNRCGGNNMMAMLLLAAVCCNNGRREIGCGRSGGCGCNQGCFGNGGCCIREYCVIDARSRRDCCCRPAYREYW